jgi:RNA polymerase sigma factor (sigma-70 family)
MSNYHEDEELLAQLRTGDRRTWKQFYDDLREPFRLFFIKYTGMESEKATELFHETMVVFHRNVMNDKLVPPLQSALRTYLFGVGKILCRKIADGQQSWETEIPEVPVMPEIEVIEDWRDKAEKAKLLLNKIGEPCRQILQLIYLKSYSMEAVAEEMDFPSTGAVRKRKFDCLKKIRSMV